MHSKAKENVYHWIWGTYWGKFLKDKISFTHKTYCTMFIPNSHALLLVHVHVHIYTHTYTIYILHIYLHMYVNIYT